MIIHVITIHNHSTRNYSTARKRGHRPASEDNSLLRQKAIRPIKPQKMVNGNYLNHLILPKEQTRKLHYRKDNRAMRPVYRCSEKSPWLRPRLLFPKLLMGFCC